jgi:hypothetical protein
MHSLAPTWGSSRYFDERELGRKREILFVDGLFKRLVVAFDDILGAKKKDDPKIRRALHLISASCLVEAGYFRKTKTAFNPDGSVKKRAETQTEYLLHMPRIQAAINEKFNASGFTIDKAAKLLFEIAKGKKKISEETIDGEGKMIGKVVRDVSASDRLRAIHLRFSLTTGLAPTKSLGVTADAADFPADGDFSSSPPPMKTVEEILPPADKRPGIPKKKEREKITQ